MDGVVTVLDPLNYDKVVTIWQDLSLHCGVPEIKRNFMPHFSWHVAESYDCDHLNVLLEDLSARYQPFNIKTAGIGIFPGEKPVVYLSVVKDRQLMEIHEELWASLTPLAVQPSPFYSPQNWMPHITLFFEELYYPIPTGWQNKNLLACVLNYLVKQELSWSITTNNFAYGCMDDSQSSFKQYQFTR